MASENSFVQPAIPRFDGHYDHWSMLMENFLRSKKYWHLIETGITTAAEGLDLSETQKKTYEDEKLKDLKAKNYLFQAIDRSILETILKRYMGFFEPKVSRNNMCQACSIATSSQGVRSVAYEDCGVC